MKLWLALMSALVGVSLFMTVQIVVDEFSKEPPQAAPESPDACYE